MLGLLNIGIFGSSRVFFQVLCCHSMTLIYALASSVTMQVLYNKYGEIITMHSFSKTDCFISKHLWVSERQTRATIITREYHVGVMFCHCGNRIAFLSHGCLLNRLFRRRSKKTSKLRVTGLCAGKSPATSEFPAQRASNAENVSFWWRHHVVKNRAVCWMLQRCRKVSAFIRAIKWDPGSIFAIHCGSRALPNDIEGLT